MSEMLDKLKELVKNSDDTCAEFLLDDSGIPYKVYEEEEWIDEGKYQLNCFYVEIEGKYYGFSQSRSGSYYSDYYYSIDDVWEFTPDTRYHIHYTFPSKEVAQEFVKWMSGSGEQQMWNYGDLELNREIKYDYEKGSFEIGNKFEENQ